jgi:hypothetical protein
MKTILLTTIAALFLATGTAQAICGGHGVSCWQCGDIRVELSQYADRSEGWQDRPPRYFSDVTAEGLPNPNALRLLRFKTRGAYLNGKLCKQVIDQ